MYRIVHEPPTPPSQFNARDRPRIAGVFERALAKDAGPALPLGRRAVPRVAPGDGGQRAPGGGGVGTGAGRGAGAEAPAGDAGGAGRAADCPAARARGDRQACSGHVAARSGDGAGFGRAGGTVAGRAGHPGARAGSASCRAVGRRRASPVVRAGLDGAGDGRAPQTPRRGPDAAGGPCRAAPQRRTRRRAGRRRGRAAPPAARSVAAETPPAAAPAEAAAPAARRPAVAPGPASLQVSFDGPAYPVTLIADGQQIGRVESPDQRVSVEAGRMTLRGINDAVFLDQSLGTITLRPDEHRILTLPGAAGAFVGVQGNSYAGLQITLDGRPLAGPYPAQIPRLAATTHRIGFRWTDGALRGVEIADTIDLTGGRQFSIRAVPESGQIVVQKIR